MERETELDFIQAQLDTLRSGAFQGGSCVLVQGEAGAGKTSLLKAARQRAPADVEWLWGACEPLLAAAPLGPLIELLDRLPPSLSQAVRSGRATPEVLSAMLSMLRDRTRPAVLMIDDVHWADSATLDLLRYLGRRIESTRALLVLCWRDDALAADHPVRLLMGSLPAQRTQRLALKPLSALAVAELAGRAGRVAEGLHAATQGNPFFVTEWLAGDGQRLPEAVRDAVLGRAAALSAAAREALDLASVAPAGLEPEVMDAIIDGAGRMRCGRPAASRRRPASLSPRTGAAKRAVGLRPLACGCAARRGVRCAEHAQRANRAAGAPRRAGGPHRRCSAAGSRRRA